MLFVVVAVGITCWGSIILTRESGRIAVMWPANGLLVALLLATRRRNWPAYLICGFVANVAANLLTGDAWFLAFSLAAANTVEVTAAILCIRQFSGLRFDLEQPRTLMVFTVFSVLLAPLLSSAIALLTLSSFSGLPNWQNTFRMWYSADVLGMATVAPCVWALQRGGLQRLLARKHVGQTILLLSSLALVTFAVFSQSHFAPPAVLFPVLLLVVFLLGFSGAAFGLLTVAAISIGYTAIGLGPFAAAAGRQLPDAIWLLQIFLLSALLTTLPFASLLEKRNVLQQALAKSEQLYRLLFEEAGQGITLYPILADGKPGAIELANPAICSSLGYSLEEMQQRTPLDFQPLGDRQVTQGMMNAMPSAINMLLKRTLLTCDGRQIPVEIHAHYIDMEGKPYILSVVADITERTRLEAERELLVTDLRRALEKVKTLQGILPTCSYCKRIRDEQNTWHQFEYYIREHSEAEFSHGVCPECLIALKAELHR
jgi:PAS domain S-box-containing protein